MASTTVAADRALSLEGAICDVVCAIVVFDNVRLKALARIGIYHIRIYRGSIHVFEGVEFESLVIAFYTLFICWCFETRCVSAEQHRYNLLEFDQSACV